jgi:hypothetical protein
MRDFKKHGVLLMSSKETKNKCLPKEHIQISNKSQNKQIHI